MKEIVIQLEDETYARAEDIAAAKNTSVNELARQLIESVTSVEERVVNRIAVLFAALDRGRNLQPVGRLRRQDWSRSN